MARAQELAREHDWLFVPPYDAPEIVAGQGTVGLEVLEQLPECTAVLVPAGGGGLLGGVALAVKS
ncbi:MAG: pyridoxal-phosphate dependent enzyme [Dehalococcoidia bacterium]